MKVILSLLMLFPINAFSQFNFWHGMVSAQKKEYPYGTMGDLVVLSGQTVSLESLYPGVRFFDFKSITINSGGTLLIPEVQTSDFVVIGVKQNLIINGTISGSGRLNSFAGLSSVTIPEESSLTVSTINQAFGGAGGKGGNTANSDKPGGAGCSSGVWVGVGGGGGGASFFERSGGAGGTCGAAGNAGANSGNNLAGAGTQTLGAGGDASGQGSCGSIGGAGGGSGGGSSGNSYCGGASVGAGGGGGFRGKHGSLLAIKVRGTISGNGTINLSGQAGFKGGNGGTGAWGGGAGGGGGGAGGSGGYLMMKYKMGNTFPNANIITTGGAGGSGGLSSGSLTTSGDNGSSGQAGYTGYYNVMSY